MKTMKLNGVLINLDNVIKIHWIDGYGLRIVTNAIGHNEYGNSVPYEAIYNDNSPTAKFAYDKLCEYALYDFDEMFLETVKEVQS